MRVGAEEMEWEKCYECGGQSGMGWRDYERRLCKVKQE